MAQNRSLGDRTEEAAAKFLELAGMTVVARNFRTPRGEIDIIATDGTTLVFVEVKARSSTRFGDPALAVHHQKQQRLRRAAQDYLRSLPERWPPCRFDVVSVHNDAGRLTFRHLIDAF